PLIWLTACFYRPALDVARLATPLPVPSTAIFTRDDGVVAWQSCRRDDARCESVEVGGPHLSLGRNPDVLRAVAARLGAPCSRSGCARDGAQRNPGPPPFVGRVSGDERRRRGHSGSGSGSRRKARLLELPRKRRRCNGVGGGPDMVSSL